MLRCRELCLGKRQQLEEETGGLKEELLLQMLPAKEQDHFQNLRSSLKMIQLRLLLTL